MDYARALAEHPKWRWEPGMRYARKTYHYRAPANCEGVLFDASCVPCLDDPATKGWLLHMLREAVEGHAFCDLESTEPDEWRVNADYLEMDGPWDFPTAPTEGEALAAALLAVWGQA